MRDTWPPTQMVRAASRYSLTYGLLTGPKYTSRLDINKYYNDYVLTSRDDYQQSRTNDENECIWYWYDIETSFFG